MKRRIPARASLHQANRPGVMNKTEAAYAEYLVSQQKSGHVHHWWYCAFKIRVAYDEAWIVIDFMVQLPDGTLEWRDVKGGPTREDALIKEKVVATLYPFRVVEVRKQKKSLGGGWVTREIVGQVE